jgi:hypothetical protein
MLTSLVYQPRNLVPGQIDRPNIKIFLIEQISHEIFAHTGPDFCLGSFEILIVGILALTFTGVKHFRDTQTLDESFLLCVLAQLILHVSFDLPGIMVPF